VERFLLDGDVTRGEPERSKDIREYDAIFGPIQTKHVPGPREINGFNKSRTLRSRNVQTWLPVAHLAFCCSGEFAHSIGGEGMKTISLLAFLIVFQLLMASGWADDIKEADYPVHYEVLSASKSDKVVVAKVCSMALRDQANPNVTINVSRKRIGSCPVVPSGQVFNGRQNDQKNAVELVILVGETKARIESWHIDGTSKNPQ
jgi:hypothetical protein